MKFHRLHLIIEMTHEAKRKDATMDNWQEAMQSSKSLQGMLGNLSFDERPFKEWARQLMESRHLTRSDVIKKSELNPTFAYQILAGQRRAKRDKLLQLAFAMDLDIETCCELLERGGVNALSPRTRRDAIIAYCLAHRMTLDECDEFLYRAGQQAIRQGYPNIQKSR
jgi:transcriptional regulator with XRE-family HTH domain